MDLTKGLNGEILIVGGDLYEEYDFSPVEWRIIRQEAAAERAALKAAA